METLDYIVEKFNLTLSEKGPTKIDHINRTIMAQTLAELGLNRGAEIGVAQGWHAELLCKANPNLELHAIDIWETYDGYNEYQDRISRYYEHAKKILSPYHVHFIKRFSMDVVKYFDDNSLDFVYIDGAHDFKNVAMDICEWSKKVRPGGIVFGHDYKRTRGKYVVEVKDVVQAYMYTKGINPWFELTNKIPDPKFGRDNPAWMFVRKESDPL